MSMLLTDLIKEYEKLDKNDCEYVCAVSPQMVSDTLDFLKDYFELLKDKHEEDKTDTEEPPLLRIDVLNTTVRNFDSNELYRNVKVYEKGVQVIGVERITLEVDMESLPVVEIRKMLR